MRIECWQCAAWYDVQSAAEDRQALCKQCGALMEIPAGEPGGRKTLAERREERHPLLRSALVVASVSFLLGLIFVPLTLFAGLGAAAAAGDAGVTADQRGFAAYIVAVLAAIAATLVGGGLGLLFRKPWGWWASVVVYAFFLLYNLKVLALLPWINWDHPNALSTALELGLLHGLPALVALVVLVLLFRASMRTAYGVKQRELQRKRRTVIRRGSA